MYLKQLLDLPTALHCSSRLSQCAVVAVSVFPKLIQDFGLAFSAQTFLHTEDERVAIHIDAGCLHSMYQVEVRHQLVFSIHQVDDSNLNKANPISVNNRGRIDSVNILGDKSYWEASHKIEEKIHTGLAKLVEEAHSRNLDVHFKSTDEYHQFEMHLFEAVGHSDTPNTNTVLTISLHPDYFDVTNK